MSFDERYKNLNKQQTRAVDTIEGPVMVVAGPGTGKTELLSMRAANILRQTDTLPENILCLTFTESGAEAMRERLLDIIGKDAYKVAIHTFHSFGTEIINQNPQYFYNGANFRASDDVTSHELLTSIFEDLPDSDVLAKKMNGDYTYLKPARFAISELKRSGLTNSELRNIVKANEEDLDHIEPIVQSVFANRINKSTIDSLRGCLDGIDFADTGQSGVPQLGSVIRNGLNRAVDEASEADSTKPITAWKNAWLTKNDRGVFVFKDRARHARLCSVGSIYDTYLHRMQESELYDFDDMILKVVHAMEVFDDLRFNMQEQYQYVMVDEFQDTNMAQARILTNLLDNPINNGRPNIMVVGDDDQAIYSFQGADVSNILDFKNQYKHVELIALTENYRSSAEILNVSREVITQGGDRLENNIAELSKVLSSNYAPSKTNVAIEQFSSIEEERSWVADNVKSKLDSGVPANEITILARRHRELESLLPYLVDREIPLSYERQENILDLDIIQLIVSFARVIIYIHNEEHDKANALLPQLLSHDAFGFDSTEIWRLSLEAYQKRVSWLEVMLSNPKFATVAKWIIELSQNISDNHLELVLDQIIGGPNDTQIDDNPDVDIDPLAEHEPEEFASPIYEYYFSSSEREKNPSKYLSFLNALITLRSKLRDYRPNQSLYLWDLVDFIDIHTQLEMNIMSRQQSASKDSQSVNLMTAHKSKGLEFEHVYILNAVDSMWGEKARSKTGANIDYPENLPIGKNGENLDERLRLFYVAMTRAKSNLLISFSESNDNDKSTVEASFLVSNSAKRNTNEGSESIPQLEKVAKLSWHQNITDVSEKDMRSLLAPVMDSYKLSPTHLNNFIDISRGGPQAFLVQNLLRFPQSISAPAVYGSAVHETLQIAHNHLLSNGEQRPIEDSIQTFEKFLEASPLNEQEIQKLSQQGADSLRVFLASEGAQFNKNQKSELDFKREESIVGDARLTGKLDLVEFDKDNKTAIVTDYKTGKALGRWQGSSDYEKIKLHKYRQQLMFYKLLIEKSRSYHNYKMSRGLLQFVEPNDQKEIVALELSISDDELHNFEQLIQKVWAKIMTFDFPDTSSYPDTYKGLLQFEEDLIDNKL